MCFVDLSTFNLSSFASFIIKFEKLNELTVKAFMSVAPFQAKDRCNGIEIDGRRIRVDFSITERAHTPTPGIYLGKPTS